MLQKMYQWKRVKKKTQLNRRFEEGVKGVRVENNKGTLLTLGYKG